LVVTKTEGGRSGSGEVGERGGEGGLDLDICPSAAGELLVTPVFERRRFVSRPVGSPVDARTHARAPRNGTAAATAANWRNCRSNQSR